MGFWPQFVGFLPLFPQFDCCLSFFLSFISFCMARSFYLLIVAAQDVDEDWVTVRSRVRTNNSVHYGGNRWPASYLLTVFLLHTNDWKEVYDHQGRAHNVTLEPGDMLLMETHSVIHGKKNKTHATETISWNFCKREIVAHGLHFSSFFNIYIFVAGHPFPLKGRYYAMIFIHFEPTGHSLGRNETGYFYVKEEQEQQDDVGISMRGGGSGGSRKEMSTSSIAKIRSKALVDNLRRMEVFHPMSSVSLIWRPSVAFLCVGKRRSSDSFSKAKNYLVSWQVRVQKKKIGW